MDLIIRNALVDYEHVDIGIENEKIVSVKENIKVEAENELDAEGKVCIPGFVDAHMHLDKSLLNEERPYEDVSGPEKGALTREMKENFTVEDITQRAERVVQHALKTGTLHLRTNVDVDGLIRTKGIQALLDLKEKYQDVIQLQVVAFSQEGFQRYPETYELLEEALEMGADMVGGHTIADGTYGKDHIDNILALAKQYEVEADFHVDESGKPEHYLLPYLCERMIEENLEGKVNAIHCCTLSALSEEERGKNYREMKKVGLNVTVAPTAISTRQLAPVKELVENDVPVALGSDNVRDFFNPLGSGDVKQVALLLSYLHRFYREEETEKIWDMITRDGASLLGVKNYGIKEGSPANLTILNDRSPKEVLANQSQPTLLIRNGKNIIEEHVLSKV